MTRLFPQIPENFTRYLFYDRYWFVYIPCDSIVKIQSFAQYLMDYLTYPVVPRVVLFLCKFAVFAMINDFISFSVAYYRFLFLHNWSGPVDWGCRIHRLYLCREVRLPQLVSYGSVDWGYRIHRLHLCRCNIIMGPRDRPRYKHVK